MATITRTDTRITAHVDIAPRGVEWGTPEFDALRAPIAVTYYADSETCECYAVVHDAVAVSSESVVVAAKRLPELWAALPEALRVCYGGDTLDERFYKAAGQVAAWIGRKLD